MTDELEKILGIPMKMFIWDQDREIMMEEWGKEPKRPDSILWSMDEKGFGVYMCFNGESIGRDIDFAETLNLKIERMG